MISGFDYGTSNCAIGIAGNSGVELLPIELGQAFMPSTLYTLDRELISDFIASNIANPVLKSDFQSLRANAIDRAKQIRQQQGISIDESAVFFGGQAFDFYLEQPDEGFFVKSPKSFLGASGLRAAQLSFFEDVVTAMMLSVKQRAEAITQQAIKHTVIGRPVNFQGRNADESNQQAIDILTIAARRAGYDSIEFLYEPIAAGLAFETSMTVNKTVLVVDIGGGTSDCAMLRMGPDYRNSQDRSGDFLGHSGERIGGNDFDIQLSGQSLMPLFGMQSTLKNGLPMPGQIFWDAVSTNDVGAQSLFTSQQTSLQLRQLARETTEPELLQRLIELREHKQNHRLVHSSEKAKIELSTVDQLSVDLGYIEQGLNQTIHRDDLAQAIVRPLDKMLTLMDEAIAQASCAPDLIFVTGGSANSPVIRQAIQQRLGSIDIVDGDHFGSVVAGLTVWANKLYQ
jgi:hypothetical chaperone protein